MFNKGFAVGFYATIWRERHKDNTKGHKLRERFGVQMYSQERIVKRVKELFQAREQRFRVRVDFLEGP